MWGCKVSLDMPLDVLIDALENVEKPSQSGIKFYYKR